MKNATFSKDTMARLRTLIDETLMGFREEPVTRAQAITKALPQAREICRDEFDATVCHALGPMFSAALARPSLRKYVPAQMLIPGIELPARIAVPPSLDALGPSIEETRGIVHVVLELATLSELGRHVAMLDVHIAGSVDERDKLKALLDMALALTDDLSAVVGKVIGASQPVEG